MSDPNDERLVPCPFCEGERGWEVVTHINPTDGMPDGYWAPCECGNGLVWESLPLIDEAELDEWIGR